MNVLGDLAKILHTKIVSVWDKTPIEFRGVESSFCGKVLPYLYCQILPVIGSQISIASVRKERYESIFQVDVIGSRKLGESSLLQLASDLIDKFKFSSNEPITITQTSISDIFSDNIYLSLSISFYIRFDEIVKEV